MRVGVIGIGGTGSAAARFLAQAGHEVLGFEQFRIGHDRGSSHGESRIVRYSYADPLYARLMGEAYPLWSALEQDAREPLLVRCGGLFFGPPGHPELQAIEQSLRASGRAYETLGAAQTQARFPAIRLNPDETAIFQADTGFLRSSACVQANVRLARAHGATILEDTPVRSVLERGSDGGFGSEGQRRGEIQHGSGGHTGSEQDPGVGGPAGGGQWGGASGRGSEGQHSSEGQHGSEAHSASGTRDGGKGGHSGDVLVLLASGEAYELDAAIVTAGPWMGTLLASLDLPLRVTRQQIVYLPIARNPSQFEPGILPVWIDAATYDYGIPSDGRIPGVKLAIHQRGETADPGAVQRTLDADYARERIAYASRRFPDLGQEVLHSQVCLYTNTPDEDFIVDRVPGLSHVWLVSACSGHGFKFTVLLGKIAAELATGGRSPVDLSRFALSRFR